ncbi:hypothetical protein UVI_02056200 [Ustilaginoidea virens]|uniref:DUF2421 domain-containing protein n=1 Tax=Ustilaginoidea virens TaxID=1159556 RepID=A0A1B5L3B2_USTVR|nr:hypothetical protein UVI_02056200 [Ustilaginoidea virens]
MSSWRRGSGCFACWRRRWARRHVSLPGQRAAFSQARLRARPRRDIVAVLGAVDPAVAFLPLDFSRATWGPDHVKALHCMVEFGTQPGSTTALVDAFKSPEHNIDRSGRLLEIFRGTTADVLGFTSRATSLSADVTHIVNRSPWYVSPSRSRRLEEHAGLGAQGVCILRTNDRVLDTHAHLCDASGRLGDGVNQEPFALDGIILSMVLEEERIVATAAAAEGLIWSTSVNCWHPEPSNAHGRHADCRKEEEPGNGSGNGSGNPYGMGVTTAVVCLVLMWWRLHLPPAFVQASVVGAATFALIVGFSWDAHHVAVQYGLLGVGYAVFWKRLVTVLVGFAAAFVIQIFPRPPSAIRHPPRAALAKRSPTTSGYSTTTTPSSYPNGPRARPRARGKSRPAQQPRRKSQSTSAQGLMELALAVSLLKLEVSTTPFDHSILAMVTEKCSMMNQCLGKLLGLSSPLPSHLQGRLAQTVGISGSTSVANIMSVLTIIESSLRTGAPSPQRLPAVPLVQSCFLQWLTRHERAELSVGLIMSENYRRYCVALSCYMTFLSTVDDFVQQRKHALGETHVVHQWEDNA